MTVRVITFDDNVASNTIPSSANADVCELSDSVTTTSRTFTSGSTDLGNVINFNQDNDGFTWVLTQAAQTITALCNNTLVTPLATTTSSTGTLTLSSITLNSVDITSQVTFGFTNNIVTINSATQIVNSNLTADNTFTLIVTLARNGTAITPITTTLQYLQPTVNTFAITTPNLDFNSSYTTATITRVFSRGNPTTINNTVFGGVAQTNGAANITFTALNRTATAAQRLLTETQIFTNATNSGDIRSFNSMATLSPTFTFPAYLASVTVAQRAALTQATMNAAQTSGAFTSIPTDQNFSWVDVGDATRNIKIFAIPRTFTSGGMINFRVNESDPLGNLQSPFMQLDLGTITGGMETYDIYEAQTGQPGAITLFVDFI